jgi:molecular chaperone DnaK (HSP70)
VQLVLPQPVRAALCRLLDREDDHRFRAQVNVVMMALRGTASMISVAPPELLAMVLEELKEQARRFLEQEH